MAAGDEAEVLAGALAALGVDPVDGVELLAVQKGRRQVARVGPLVVKAFARREAAAFRREREGLQALTGTGLGVELVDSGDHWVATGFVEGTTVPMHLEVGEAAIHRALGPWLAALHAVGPAGMRPWSVVDRLRARLAGLPPRCPPALADDLRLLVEPLLGFVMDDAFVHGDWGTANVLVRPEAPAEVVAIIDLEDAHRGDPAEDFAWQVLAGPTGPQLAAMAPAYGRSLGPHAVERLVVCGAEKCLDVLGWSLAGAQGERFHGRCVATLEELVAGTWPEAP